MHACCSFAPSDGSVASRGELQRTRSSHLCRSGTLAEASAEMNSPAGAPCEACSLESQGPTSTVPSAGRGFAMAFAGSVVC